MTLFDFSDRADPVAPPPIAKIAPPARAECRLAIPQRPPSFPPMRVEVEQEQDGRWIADIVSIPGAMAYGATKSEAVAKGKRPGDR